MKLNMKTALIPALVLVTAACASDEPDGDDMMAADAADQTSLVAVTNEDALPTAAELNDIAQGNYDKMDRKAISDEYDRNRDTENEQMKTKMQTVSSNTAQTASSNTSQTSSSNTSDAAEKSAKAMSVPKRSEMDFAYLDRNDDGKLSVAEYAVWALPTNPNIPEPNDAKKPYLTSDEINQAGQTFFYFDKDGDTYLGEDEFMMARNSART